MPVHRRAAPSSTAPVLDLRALNRATLDRQLLLTRRRMRVTTALEHLVGLQAQATDPPYLGLLARLDGYHPDDLVRLVARRDAVRATLMRGTIHLVTARDALWLRPLLQPVMDRTLTSSPARRRVAAVGLDELTAAATEVLGAGPVSNPELAAALTARWPDLDADALAACARSMVPTVQVPPRGLWRTSGPVRHTTLPAWLGRPLTADASLEELVRRYLTAFGPASVADVQKWCGLQGLRPVVEAMAVDGSSGDGATRSGLRRVHDASGRELWDVPRAPLPDAAPLSRCGSCPTSTTC